MIKATVTLDDAGITEAVREWGKARGMKVTGHRLSIETGDPLDPREGGYRRETIMLDVELAALDIINPGTAKITGAL